MNYIHSNGGIIPIDKVSLKHRIISFSSKVKQVTGISCRNTNLVEVSTEYNQAIVADDNLVLVLLPNLSTKWVLVKDLEVGQYVAFNHDVGLGAPSGHVMTRPTRMTKDWSLALGYLMNSYLAGYFDANKLTVGGTSDLTSIFYKCADFPYTLVPSPIGDRIVISDTPTLNYLANLFEIKNGIPTKIPDCILESSRLEVSFFLSVIFLKADITSRSLEYRSNLFILNQLRQILWSYFNVLTTIEDYGDNEGNLIISDSALLVFNSRIKLRSGRKKSLIDELSLDTPNRCLWLPYAKEHGLVEYRGGENASNRHTGLYENKCCWQQVTGLADKGVGQDTQIFLNVKSSYSVNGLMINKPNSNQSSGG